MSEYNEFHQAEDAEDSGEGICRTCCEPIWNEGGTFGHRQRAEGWSDRIARGGDSLVCFSAVEYRHVPLKGREAYIYDKAFSRGIEHEATGVTSQPETPEIFPGTRAALDRLTIRPTSEGSSPCDGCPWSECAGCAWRGVSTE